MAMGQGCGRGRNSIVTEGVWPGRGRRDQPAPVTVLTSDPEDLLMLCGPGVRVIKV